MSTTETTTDRQGFRYSQLNPEQRRDAEALAAQDERPNCIGLEFFIDAAGQVNEFRDTTPNIPHGEKAAKKTTLHLPGRTDIQPSPLEYARRRVEILRKCDEEYGTEVSGQNLRNAEMDLARHEDAANPGAGTLMRECLEAEAKQRESLHGCAEMRRRESDAFTLGKMREFGGRFVRALAVAYECADSENRAKLRTAFPEVFEKYSAWPDRSTHFHGSEIHRDLI